MAIKVVGVEGFEPPTSCSQSRRATKLRYTPNLTGMTREGTNNTGKRRFRQFPRACFINIFRNFPSSVIPRLRYNGQL
jgi:hypothetical protein